MSSSPRWLYVFLIGLAFQAWGHGEDKLGPNGGFIRMPSNFHTEVVPVKDDQFEVYLLDINFKNPTLEKANIQVQQKVAGKNLPVKCQKTEKAAFLCILSQGQNLKVGELVLQSKRLGQKGVAVAYALPLALTKSKRDSKENHHHH
jgi:hypothetical protein